MPSKTPSVSDLKKLDVKALTKLKANVEKALKEIETRSRSAALADLKARAKAMGYSLGDLVGEGKTKAPAAEKAPKKATAKRAKVVPKYAHPENAALTWTGRGRQPKWVAEAVASGKTLDQLAI